MRRLNDIGAELRERVRSVAWGVLALCALPLSVYAAQPWDIAFTKDTQAVLDAAQRVSVAGVPSRFAQRENYLRKAPNEFDPTLRIPE